MAKTEVAPHRMPQAQIYVVTPMTRESEIFLDIKKKAAKKTQVANNNDASLSKHTFYGF